MATPACAGAGALVRQYYREGRHCAAGAAAAPHAPSAALVKATLLHAGRPAWARRNASDPDALSAPPASDGPAAAHGGFGRVDLSRALAFADGPRLPGTLCPAAPRPRGPHLHRATAYAVSQRL
jgi:hypothetical protein